MGPSASIRAEGLLFGHVSATKEGVWDRADSRPRAHAGVPLIGLAGEGQRNDIYPKEDHNSFKTQTTSQQYLLYYSINLFHGMIDR